MITILRAGFQTFPTEADAFAHLRKNNMMEGMVVAKIAIISVPVPPRPNVKLPDDTIVTYEARNYVRGGISYSNIRQLLEAAGRIPGDRVLGQLVDLPAVTAKWELENK